MRNDLQSRLANVLASRRIRKRWQRVACGLMAVVMVFTTYALILPGISMTQEEKKLNCSFAVHTHTEDCYENSKTGKAENVVEAAALDTTEEEVKEDPLLICGKADYVVHSHDSSCYDGEGQLVCTLPEIEAHTHDESCIRQVLICGKKENNRHTHTDSCYQEELGCGKEEILLHTHDDTCLDEDGNLICGLLEVTQHVHGDGCFQTVDAQETEEPEASETVEPTAQPAETVAVEAVMESSEPDTPEETTVLEPQTITQTATQYAASGTIGTSGNESSVTWSIEEEDGQYILHIQGTGAMKNFSYYSSAPWYSYRTQITGVEIEDGITSIGSYAFYNCTNLTEVSIPDSVTSIGSTAFSGCSGLTAIEIPAGVTTIQSSLFSGCTKLTSIQIPAGVTSIGSSAFYNCTSLTDIEIPDKVTSIGSNAFYNCIGLTDIQIPSSVLTIGDYAFQKCTGLRRISIPETVKTWGTSVFSGCTGLVSATMPSTWTSIPGSLFSGCTSLKRITIPDGVTTIGSSAFSGCTSLRSVTIPEHVTTIQSYAFSGCSSLSSIEIPANVKTIGDYAFKGCTGVTKVEIPATVTSWGTGVFSGCTGLVSATMPSTWTSIPDSLLSGCTKLTSIEIPASVTKIGSSAFSGCSGLTAIEIPGSVTTIGSSAFSSCTGLTTVTVPDTVTSLGTGVFSSCTRLVSAKLPSTLITIPSSLFSGCTKLQSIEIPSSVTSIGSSAFSSCSGLTTIEIPSSVTTIGNSAFSSCSGLTTVTVPDTVTSLGTGVFSSCTGLVSVKLPSTLTTIPSSLFSGCNKLQSIAIPDSVTSIGSYAFSSCTSLKSIDIPDSVKTIGNYAFQSCSLLEKIQLPKSLTYLYNYAFYTCGRLKTVVYNVASTPTISSSAFSGCTKIQSLVIGEDVNTVTTTVLNNIVKNTTIDTELSFRGPNTFTVTGSDLTFSNMTLTAGTYYVNENGALYRLDTTTGTAALVMVPSSLEDAHCNNLFSDFTANGANYSVASIEKYAFKDCTNLTTINIPATVTISGYAFYGCTKLTTVNGKTTLSEALATLNPNTSSMAFWNTGLWTETDKSSGIYQVVDKLESSANTEKDSIYHLSVSIDDIDDVYPSYQGATDTNVTTVYTGVPVKFSVSLDQTASETATIPVLRVYFQADEGSTLYDLINKQVFNEKYSLDTELKFKNTDGSTITGIFHSTDVPGRIYFELPYLKQADTLNTSFSVKFPNYTAGGTVLCWVDTADGTGETTGKEVLQINWITGHKSFTLSDSVYSSGSIEVNGDGTENGIVTLKNLSFKVSMSQTGKSASGSDIYGQNPMDHAVFQDTLTLPDSFQWRAGVIEAIQAHNWYVSAASSATQNYYVTLTDADGQKKTLKILTLYVYSGTSTCLSPGDLTVTDSGEVTVSWTWQNTSASAEITSPTSPTIQITYGDEVIQLKEGSLGESSSSITAEFKNTASVIEYFRYGETADSKATATTTKTIDGGSYTLLKATDQSFTTISGTSKTFGEYAPFYLGLKNNTAQAATGPTEITDTLKNYYYIAPDDMEIMLEDTYGKNLTITIDKGILCPSDNQSVITNITNNINNSVITASATISDILANNGTLYPQQAGETLTQHTKAGGTEQYVTVTIGWSDDKTYWTVTVTRTDSSGNATEDANIYSVGQGQKYSTLSALWDDIGFINGHDTTYTCQWKLGDYQIWSGETRSMFTVRSTVKNTFMWITQDMRWSYLGRTDYHSSYDTANNTAIASSTSKTASYYVYGDFRLQKSMSNYSDSTSGSFVAGDILKYTNTVTHYGNTAYEALPLVDQLQGGQELLVSADDNTQLADQELSTKIINGDTYYVLDQAGTYEHIWVGNYLADKVTVSIAGGATGVVTRIYWYLNLSAHSYACTQSVNYYALVDPTNAMDGDSATYALKGTVWLGDHGSRRLYDYSYGEAKLLSISKYIVTNYSDSVVTKDHDPTTDVLDDFSFITPGETVTYRLSITSIGSSDDFELRLNGSMIYDELPGDIGKQSADSPLWSPDRISITYVPEAGSSVKISDETKGAWDVVYTSSTSKTQKIQWNSDFTITLRGTIYLYVTITFPTAEDENWNYLCKACGGSLLTNTWYVSGVKTSVTHELAVQQQGVLQKGVYDTGTMNSYGTKTTNKASTGRQNYSNDSAAYGYVQYYITIYNSGQGRLYLNDIQDVLPKGFTYVSSSATYLTNMVLVDQDGKTISAAQKSASITGTTSKFTDSNGSERWRVTFSIKESSYTSTINKADTHAGGKYYLLPNQSLTILFTVRTNGYEDTEDRAENVAGMAVYDYCSYEDTFGEPALVLDHSVSITPNYNKGTVTANDGTGSLISSTEASANLGMNVSGTSGANWLTSSVTVERGQIVPGIQKTAVESWYHSNNSLEWAAKVTNGGAEAIRGYIITDVMMSPYTFAGTIYYQINNSSGGSAVAKTAIISANNLPAVGAEKTVSNTNLGDIVVKLDQNSDGNMVLTLYFKNTTKAAIPAGGYGILSLTTEKTGNEVVSSANYINTAYFTPTTQTYQTTGQGQALSSYEVNIDKTTFNRPTVTSQALVSVSSGYSTGAYKTVTELDESNALTNNKAVSSDATNYIVLDLDENSVFRYDLKVSNSGNSSNSSRGGSSAQAIKKFVLIDNLPEVGDHTTFYKASGRYSDFRVDFYEGNLNFQVYTITGSTTNELSDSQYSLVFSEQTDLDYNSNKNLWDGGTVSATDKWYTLDEINSSDDLKLSDMRSFRVVIADESLTPSGVEIHICFNAAVHAETDEEGNVISPTYSDIAWNSYGYLYQVQNDTLRSSPSMVGVKIRGTVYLNKSLVGPDPKVAYAAEKDETFQYIIYPGKAKTLTSSTDVNDLARQLYEQGVTKFLITTATVKQGESSSGNITLEGLQAWTYDAKTQKAVVTEDIWTWEDNTQYTVMEVPTDENRDYDFYSLDGSSYNSSTFTYVRSSSYTIQSVNQRISWELNILKQDRQTGDLLPGAVFALYTKNEKLKATMTSEVAATLGLSSPAAESQVIDDTTWYLMDWGTTNTSGVLKWTGLMEDQYYIQEIKPPTGYEMNVDQGQVVNTTANRRGSQPVSVPNDLVFALPKTGGIGTTWTTLGGAALLLAGGAGYCLKKKRKGGRRK
jgi:LPXTG-motif cell wall-anchored protein